jgi:hypothetical protein
MTESLVAQLEATFHLYSMVIASQGRRTLVLLGIGPRRLPVWRSLGAVWRSMAMVGGTGEAPRWLLPVPHQATPRLHALAATGVCKPGGMLWLHGLVRAGWRGRVFEVRERFEILHHLAHQRPVLGILCEAIPGQLGHLLCTFHGDASTKFGIHKAVESLLLFEKGVRPFHQVVLPNWPALVHRPPACHELQQHHPEAINIALGCQVSWKWNVLSSACSRPENQARLKQGQPVPATCSLQFQSSNVCPNKHFKFKTEKTLQLRHQAPTETL